MASPGDDHEDSLLPSNKWMLTAAAIILVVGWRTLKVLGIVG